jgi:hypothetical protein
MSDISNEVINKDEQKEGIPYYMMSMPEWFINLPVEKKISLAKEFTKDSPSDKILTKEEVAKLVLDS